MGPRAACSPGWEGGELQGVKEGALLPGVLLSSKKRVNERAQKWGKYICMDRRQTDGKKDRWIDR